MKMKLVTSTPDSQEMYSYYCPACECDHAIWTKNGQGKATWDFNGDLENPTVSPSVKVHGFDWKKKKDFICHFFIKNGKIRYLNDCTHSYAGKTINMQDI